MQTGQKLNMLVKPCRHKTSHRYERHSWTMSSESCYVTNTVAVCMCRCVFAWKSVCVCLQSVTVLPHRLLAGFFHSRPEVITLLQMNVWALIKAGNSALFHTGLLNLTPPWTRLLLYCTREPFSWIFRSEPTVDTSIISRGLREWMLLLGLKTEQQLGCGLRAWENEWCTDTPINVWYVWEYLEG